jgi:predicted RNA-binding protein
MCEADAYLTQGEKQELVMKAVDVIEPVDGGIKLVDIFGNQKFLHAAIHSLSLVDHKVFLMKIK